MTLTAVLSLILGIVIMELILTKRHCKKLLRHAREKELEVLDLQELYNDLRHRNFMLNRRILELLGKQAPEDTPNQE